jgi:hypothetical protein
MTVPVQQGTVAVQVQSVVVVWPSVVPLKLGGLQEQLQRLSGLQLFAIGFHDCAMSIHWYVQVPGLLQSNGHCMAMGMLIFRVSISHKPPGNSTSPKPVLSAPQTTGPRRVPC